MTNDDVHLTLAFATFFFIFVFPVAAMVLAIIWLLFALLVEDYDPEAKND